MVSVALANHTFEWLKSVPKGAEVNEAFLPPKNAGVGLEKGLKNTGKPVEQEENHEKGPHWSWAGNQMEWFAIGSG